MIFDVLELSVSWLVNTISLKFGLTLFRCRESSAILTATRMNLYVKNLYWYFFSSFSVPLFKFFTAYFQLFFSKIFFEKAEKNGRINAVKLTQKQSGASYHSGYNVITALQASVRK